jgi:NADH-quinone oxidoreductase subunit M
MGMPGLSGFVAEFPILQGVWAGPSVNPGTLNLVYTPNFNYYPIIVILSMLGIIVTAAYVLNVVQRVFFGEFNEERFPGIVGITAIDKTALVLLSAVLVILGVYPRIMSTMIEASMRPIYNLLSGR